MVRDNVRNLVWEVKTDDGSIHDEGDQYTWQNVQNVFIAALNAKQFGGHSDWRVPTIEELASITELGRYGPAINTDYFPNTKSSFYWPSTTLASNTERAWAVFFSDGSGRHYPKSESFYVRAVRGGQAESSDRFTINGDSTVTDTTTGLMWQQATDGGMTWDAAISHCEALSLAGYEDWRLPNRRELRSIVDYSKYSPAVETAVFPSTFSLYYWSSTTHANTSPDNAWVIHFDNGYDSFANKVKNTYWVHAVRGGQSLLSGHLVILSPRLGSRWELGDSMPIRWDTQDIAGDAEISISRQGGKSGTFEIIAGATENDGIYDWTVTGELSVNGVLLIVPLNDPDKETTQGLFTIQQASVPPSVKTASIASINATNATAGGEITSGGGADVTARGVCWSTSENPTIADSHTSDGTGTGSFTSSITGLSPGTTYHVRAYATNRAGTGYGADTVFTSAASNTLYVKGDGSCGGHLPCYATIQEAISAAGDEDTILVAHGDYFETVVLDQDKSLRLLNGWDDLFETSTLFSIVNAMRIEKGTLLVEGLSLIGE